MNGLITEWLPYALPFRQPWLTSHGRLEERRGQLLRLQSPDGLTGWGDCAPLPEFGIAPNDARRFAEETAQLDIAAQSAGLSLAEWLGAERDIGSLAVNGVLGMLSEVSRTDLETASAAGFQLFKLKVGLGPVREEIAQLHDLARHLPAHALFRLDANHAWTMSDATYFLDACRELPIDGLEEPLHQPTLAELATLQSRVSFPLAIDESWSLIDASFFRQAPVGRLILKPARLGGLGASLSLARQAQASGLECIVTSSLESACGILACAHLAAAIAPNSCHGLATAGWFTRDIGKPPTLHQGRLILPTASGLGFIPEH